MGELQIEVTKQRERRQSDARVVRQQARTSMVVHEDRTRRLSIAHEGDQGTWWTKLRQSEQRTEKLEQELQRLKQTRGDKPAHALALEAENMRLTQEVEEAERKAEEFEVEDRLQKREL